MSDNIDDTFGVISEFKFVMLPQWLLEMQHEGKPLPSKSIHLYSCLMYYANNDTRKCYPSYETLSELSGMSRSSIHRHLQTLLDIGAIIWEQRTYKGFNTSNMYTLPKTPMKTNKKHTDISVKEEEIVVNDPFDVTTKEASPFFVGDEVKAKVLKDPFWGAMVSCFGFYPADRQTKNQWGTAIAQIKTYTDNPDDIVLAYEKYFDYMPGKKSEVRITVSALAKHFPAILAFKPQSDTIDNLSRLESLKEKNIVDIDEM